MSLIKKTPMTEKRLAAVRKAQSRSRGPSTPEGRQRIRKANLRHGLFSRDEEAAMRALGEDPEEFARLLAGLGSQESAIATLKERLGQRLARLVWRTERADRMREGQTLNRARQQDSTRDGRLHVEMMRLKMTSRNWQLLTQAVSRPRYVTTPADLEMMQNLHKEGVAKDMSEVALALFYQLREPGLPRPGDPNFEDAEEEAKRWHVMQKIRAIFALPPLPDEARHSTVRPNRTVASSTDAEDADSLAAPDGEMATEDDSSEEAAEFEAADPCANITEEEWEGRESVRQLLENLLTRQVEIFDAQHRELLRKSINGPSCYERAAELTPTEEKSAHRQRVEDSDFRQVARIASLLIRLERLDRSRTPSEPAAR